MLRDLASRISADEVRHYKHFLRFFNECNAREGVGRARVLKALKHSSGNYSLILQGLTRIRLDSVTIAHRHLRRISPAHQVDPGPAERQRLVDFQPTGLQGRRYTIAHYDISQKLSWRTSLLALGFKGHREVGQREREGFEI